MDMKALPLIGLLVSLALIAQCAGQISHAATRLVPSPTYLPETLEEALKIDRAEGRCYTAVDRWRLARGYRKFTIPHFDC